MKLVPNEVHVRWLVVFHTVIFPRVLLLYVYPPYHAVRHCLTFVLMHCCGGLASRLGQELMWHAGLDVCFHLWTSAGQQLSFYKTENKTGYLFVALKPTKRKNRALRT